MQQKADQVLNLLKPDTFLPSPSGAWGVGYVDIMTEGRPDASSFIRLYYPTLQKHELLPERCPVWTEHDTKHGFVNFLHAMVKRWPSWVNTSEFSLLGLVKPLESLASWALPPVLSMGWSLLAGNPRIPVIHQAQPAAPPSSQWPVVVFSHGMGCNRYAYSKVCYDLCSEGVVVAAVEHRDGSACHSRYVLNGETFQIPHLQLGGEEQEYSKRNQQVNLRAAEVIRTVDLVNSLNEGIIIPNTIPEEAGYSLNQFVGQLNMNEVYLMGHSFGGCTVLLAASKDDRIKGIVSIDPWMFPASDEQFRVTKPVLMINTEMFANNKNVTKVREVCDDLQGRVLDGAVHLVHTDAPLLFENDLIKSGLGMKCSRSTVEVLKENHSILSDWILKKIEGREIEKRFDWGVVV